MKSKKSKNSHLPLFIEKLLQILEDRSIQDVISWTSTMDSFHIKSITKFTETILPTYFKHNNFSSFIRQLNMYGFRKIRHQDGEHVYENENFIKGQRVLLKNIKRRINQQKDDKVAIYNPDSSSMSRYSVTRQIQEMKTKQKDLEQICRHLLMQNQKLMDENNVLMKRMKDESRRKQRKVEHLLLKFMASSQNPQNQLSDGCEPIVNNNGNGNNILSIMNQDQLDKANGNFTLQSDETPLDALSNAISQNKNMRKFKQMLDKYYLNDEYEPRMSKRRASAKSTNKTNHSASDTLNRQNMYEMLNNPNELREEPVSHDLDHSSTPNNQFSDLIHEESIPQENYSQPNEDGFMSINEFMNLDEDNNALPKEDFNQNEDDFINLEESR